MFTIFFNSQGIVSVDIPPDKSTINAHYYTNTVLPQVLHNRAEAAPTRSGSRVLLHHDNVSFFFLIYITRHEARRHTVAAFWQ